jgi:hypothetical protein
MHMKSFPLAHAVACAGLLVIGVSAQATTIVAGSGTNPPASVTGIYEIARLKSDGGRVYNVLALVNKGVLREVHARGPGGYLRRVAGSTAVRVSTSTYAKLLTLAGAKNANVDFLPLATRCQFYSLAGLARTGMNCPSILPAPMPEAPSNCPAGYEVKISIVNGAYFIQCERVTISSKLLPAPSGRFVSSLFGYPVSLAYVNPKVSATDYGAWAFGGLNFMIGWLNDGP